MSSEGTQVKPGDLLVVLPSEEASVSLELVHLVQGPSQLTEHPPELRGLGHDRIGLTPGLATHLAGGQQAVGGVLIELVEIVCALTFDVSMVMQSMIDLGSFHGLFLPKSLGARDLLRAVEVSLRHELRLEERLGCVERVSNKVGKLAFP